jgi:hypothetical protein
MLSISEPVCHTAIHYSSSNWISFLTRLPRSVRIEWRNNESHCFLLFGIISPADLDEMMQLCLTFPAFFTPWHDDRTTDTHDHCGSKDQTKAQLVLRSMTLSIIVNVLQILSGSSRIWGALTSTSLARFCNERAQWRQYHCHQVWCRSQ